MTKFTHQLLARKTSTL